MSMRQSTRRTLAVLGLVAVLALATVFSISGFVLAEVTQADVTGKQARLAQLRAQMSRVDRTMRERSAPVESRARLFLPAMSIGAAGADLQRRLMKMIADAKGRVVSVRVVPQEPEEGLQKVMIDIAFESDIAATRDILLDVERAAPLAFVEQMNVRRLESSPSHSERNGTAQTPLLAVSLKVSNYMHAATIGNGQ